MTYIRKEDGTCKCGRSPTGDCIGWHKLTEEQYQEKTEEDKEKIIKEAEEKKSKFIFVFKIAFRIFYNFA